MAKECDDARKLLAMLEWQIAAGVDEPIGGEPRNRLRDPKPRIEEQVTSPQPPTPNSPPTDPMVADPMVAPVAPQPSFWQPQPGTLASPRSAAATASELAAAAQSIADLKQVLEAFDGCPLKATATRLCFADGNPEARYMIIGEAPGPEEDRQGLPFVGRSGKLLDRMLAAIGLDRQQVHITNVIYWRPPGNRTPTAQEIAVCLPFMQRQIAIIQPDYLLLIGGISAKTLLGRTQGILRLRGRWEAYDQPGLAKPIPALATLHPAYLLRQPAQKRLAWRDFLAFRQAIARGENPLSMS